MIQRSSFVMVESKFKWSSSSTADDAALVKSVASTIRRDMLALMSGFSACDRAAPTQFGRLARGARLYPVLQYSIEITCKNDGVGDESGDEKTSFPTLNEAEPSIQWYTTILPNPVRSSVYVPSKSVLQVKIPPIYATTQRHSINVSPLVVICCSPPHQRRTLHNNTHLQTERRKEGPLPSSMRS